MRWSTVELASVLSGMSPSLWHAVKRDDKAMNANIKV